MTTNEFIPGELRARIDATGDEFDRFDLARKFIRDMKRKHPDEWDEWMFDAETSRILTMIRRIVADRRHTVRKRHMRDVANNRASATIKAKTPTPVAFPAVPAGSMHYGVENGKFRRLRAMRRPEVLATAAHCEHLGQGSLLQAAVLRTIAKRMPDDVVVVRDVCTDEQLDTLFGEQQVTF